MMFLDAEPNPAHRKLAEMEQKGKLTAVITQNIDGLHQLAGSKNVLELHGSIHRNYCMKCGKFYDAKYVKYADCVPRCTSNDQCIRFTDRTNTPIDHITVQPFFI